MPSAAAVVRIVWVVGYLIGTTTHVADIVHGGVNTYDGFPTALRVFWLSLTVLDPLIVVLLLRRRRLGIVLGVVVILLDIAVNWTVYATIGGITLFGVVSQSLFALFIVATARPLWGSFAGTKRA